ncbi:MAG: hypothetical protein MMC23_004330 [Stictis urceolatum]|nr:hypothetical protein [Stictis urceolata]
MLLDSVDIQSLPRYTFITAAIALLIRNIIVWTYRLFFHPLAKYPGPWLAKVSDLYGVYHNVRGQLHIKTEEGHQKYGPLIRQGPNKLVANSAQALHQLYYSNDVVKSEGYVTMLPSKGAFNVFTAVDKGMHRFKRKILDQGFSDRSIKAFEPRILNQIDQFVRNFTTSASTSASSKGWSAPVNMTSACRHLGYDIMGEFGFGQSFDLQTKTANHFLIDAVEATATRAGAYVQYPRLKSLNLEILVARRLYVMRKKYLDLMSSLVKSRRALANDARNDLFSHAVDAKDPETGRQFSEDELWAESRFLLIAGADTASTSLASLFFYLTGNPDVYEKLAKEVRSTFKSPEEIRMGPKINSCTYLRAVIDEAMRMSPPISSTLWREILSPGLTLDSDFVPPGVVVGASPYAVHHNPDIFPDPYSFKPERWIESKENPKEVLEKAKHGFSPFSLGSRSCAGRTMAYAELSDTVARTIWWCDFKRAEGDLGKVAEGHEGVRGPRGRKGEFQMFDHITCNHDGPFVVFGRREGLELEGP